MSYEVALALAYVAVLTAIAIHDVRTLRAPNVVVYPALGLAVLASLALGPAGAREALLGGVSAFVVMLLLAILSRGAMGLGDTKVGALSGMAVGASGVAPMLAVTFVGGGIVAAGVLVLRLQDRRDAVAFTPFLLVGVIGALLWHDTYLVR